MTREAPAAARPRRSGVGRRILPVILFVAASAALLALAHLLGWLSRVQIDYLAS